MEEIRQLRLDNKKKSKFEPHKEKIKEYFLRFKGNCTVVRQQIQEELNLVVNIRTLRKFCEQFRKELSDKIISERYETAPGQQMQIDFGQKLIKLGGKEQKVHFFVGVLSYSRRVYVKAYASETQASWLDGIESSFQYYGGVPMSILSDNTKCLIKEHRHRGATKLTDKYLNFCQYWHVRPIASTPYHPQSKGKCERIVRYVKENALEGREFETLSELNRYLENWCRNHADNREMKSLFNGETTPKARFLAEKDKLLPCKARIALIREETRTVGKDSLIRIDNLFYQVPSEVVGLDVQILIDDQSIVVSRKGIILAELDKTASVYMPREQNEIKPPVTELTDAYPEYGGNSLQ